MTEKVDKAASKAISDVKKKKEKVKRKTKDNKKDNKKKKVMVKLEEGKLKGGSKIKPSNNCCFGNGSCYSGNRCACCYKII